MMADKTKRRQYATEVKNRAEQARLEEDLANLEREKQRELKLLNIQKQKFKSRYSKSVKEAHEVTMYKTHYPGFCYTRTGEQRNLPRPEKTTSLQFEHIRSLIFTDGEVDLEKVLCLHLLSVHRTETLTPPKRKLRLMCREHSPTERLVEKSKRGFSNFERLSKLLPLYTIELIDHGAMGEKNDPPINDGRLASRILINEKLMALINTVATALEKTNMEKFKHLVVLGNNPELMRKMLKSTHMGEFLDSLSDHKLINSSDSFVLTPPFQIKAHDLSVKTSHGNLEHVVTHLRENVLQPPTRKSHELREVEETFSLFSEPSTSDAQSMDSKPTRSAPSSPRASVKMDLSLPEPSKMAAKADLRRASDEDKRLGRHMKIDFIAKNKELAGKTKRIEYEDDDDDWNFVPKKKTSLSSGKTKTKSPEPALPAMSSLPAVDEVDSVTEKSVEEAEESSSKLETTSEVQEVEEKPKKRQVWERPTNKHNIRHSNCPACMERWKIPLPSPKTPRVKESDVLPEIYGNTLRTNHQHRISMMINKAMYDLQSYDRRYSQENERFKKIALTKKDIENGTLDNVYLNPMDLAKIEQEIKERETQKKLEKFLERYSKDKK